MAGPMIGYTACTTACGRRRTAISSESALASDSTLASRERFGQDGVERLSGGDTLLELRGLGLERVVGELLHLRLERVDFGDDAVQLAQEPFVAAAEDTGEQFVDHR